MLIKIDLKNSKTIFSGPGGFDQGFGQPFDNYGPPQMVGRPPFGRPPRGFGGPMIRGMLIPSHFLSYILLYLI
jgi:hypothetical protein